MPELSPDIAPEVVIACQAGAAEAASALSRTFESELQLAVGEPTTWSADHPPQGFGGPGLIAQFAVGGISAVVVLPMSTKLVPAWVQSPDATGESRLSTLAQELSMLLLPESLLADEFAAAYVENIAAALEDAELASDAALVPLEVTGGEQSGQLTLLWPLAAGKKLFASAASAEAENVASTPAVASAPAAASQPRHLPYKPTDLAELPPYSRHLLKITVPVIVNLVSKKQSIHEIARLVPGAIISFDKPCDAPLEMLVNNRKVAVGEAVKVGERFGLQITKMVLPPEQFGAVRKRPAS